MSNDKAALSLSDNVAHCTGAWDTEGIAGLRQRLVRLPWPTGLLHIDGARISAFDTSGALVLIELVLDLRKNGCDARLINLSMEHQALVNLVLAHRRSIGADEPQEPPSFLADLGRNSWEKIEHVQSFLAFLGEASVAVLRALRKPHRIRWRPFLAIIEHAGLDAMPIIGLLCFLIGVVIAYQGGNLLKTYGANIFIVELVSIAMIRELAPLMAAIIVAGRTGSAFTAQIGTMIVTEEVDALRTIGIDPFDMLVLPKLLGLFIALPLLTIYADIVSIFGGMVVALFVLDVSFADFTQRIPNVVSLISFAYGLGKTPVFALVIALVGCYQGFRVRGGADSVGQQTTQSVVQSIFLVIVLNAIFAVSVGGAGL